MFTDRDVLNANKVCLLGQTTARELFMDEMPIGREIRVKNVSFRVVGVPEQSASQAANHPSPVRFTHIDQILVSAYSAAEISDAIDQMTEILRERHRIRNNEPDDFIIRNMTEMTRTLTSTARVMTNLLLCVAMISLVVGGVGIMNIMLVYFAVWVCG